MATSPSREHFIELLEQQKHLFDSTSLRTVGGSSPPRTTITDDLMTSFLKMFSIIKPMTFVEIGAHEASFSCKVKNLYPNMQVVALEANPHVFSHYKNHVSVQKSGIIYEQCAISDHNGQVEFNIPTLVAGTPKSLGNMMGSLIRLGIPNSEHETINVRCVTLDTYMEQYSNAPLALWIDVEGAVDKILGGGVAALGRAAIVICELETSAVWEGQVMASEIIKRFAELGLLPIARDCQKAFQYNVIFAASALLESHELMRVVEDYTNKVRELIVA